MSNESGLGGDPTAGGAQRAVFLSYAYEDVEATQRICAALRAAGIAVWFDQNELRGGDAWDASIRKQIRSCALFVPIISTNAHARIEGYFRLEWKLAVDRSHLIAPDRAFLLPVVIDGTLQTDERIPERFREVQWTPLPSGETPLTFVERVSRLLSPDAHVAPARTSASAASASARLSHSSAGASAAARRTLRRVSTSSVQFVAPAQRKISEKSIAVLPFVDMSQKKDQEYFSDGLSEELIDLLTQVQDLRVPARTSSFYFKNKSEKIATIANELGVAHILEGSVRKAGNTIRVTAHLIHADNGYHLWSKTYDRDVKDIFKVQDEIAGAVVEALKAELLPTQEVVNQHRTGSTEAYEQYLLGRKFLDQPTPDSLGHAVVAFTKAVALDMRYASAYAGLAQAEANLADRVGDPAGLERAAVAAERAVALAPNSADGYTARGTLRCNWMWTWDAAAADFEKAFALDPSGVGMLESYSRLLAATGRLPEAINAIKRSIEVDPLLAASWLWLGRCLAAAGDLASARDAFGRVLEINPDHASASFHLGVAELLAGLPDRALAAIQQVGDPGWRRVGMAFVAHSMQPAPEAQRALDELIAKNSQYGAFQIAQVYAWRDEKDKAFEWLDRAYKQRDGGLQYVMTDPMLASLRDDRRYGALLRKLNLA